MNSRFKVSPGAWCALVLAAMCAVGAWVAAQYWRPRSANLAGAVAAATAERDQLRGNEDAVRDRHRQLRNDLQRHAWAPAALDRLRQQLGAGWRWDASRDGGRLRATVERVDPKLAEWPAYLRLVSTLGAMPGLAVESVEVTTAGSGRSRRFEQVRLRLRFLVAPGNDAERAAGVPLPVVPADGPAPARKIGPVTSFRPDPPGPSAGIQPNQNPQDKSP